MKTYNDLLEALESEERKRAFILNAISEHKASAAYKQAADGMLYMRGLNATIMNYKKLLYTITGKVVPDNYSANHKCASGFFRRATTQATSYLLGNGISFEKPDTKEKLGKTFDSDLYIAEKKAAAQSVVFGFVNSDHIEFFELLEFVPLYDEENGALMAGIRFWQIDNSKPLRATLFEADGYTDYIKRSGEDLEELHPKRPYKEIVKITEAEGERTYLGENYPSFPIVPLWANPEKQSELVGKREQIDCYDLIKSGFANDLDDASMIYWTLENCGGMSDIDLVKFKERMKFIGVANMDGGDEGSKATAHTLDVPYQGREAYLSRLEKDLYKDFMLLDTEQIAAGNITATQIEAAYEPLDEKADETEMCLHKFIDGILRILGVDDVATFKRSKVINKTEETQMVLLAAEYLDEETILRKLPFLTEDEIAGILERKDREEVERYSAEADDEEVEEATINALEETLKG